MSSQREEETVSSQKKACLRRSVYAEFNVEESSLITAPEAECLATITKYAPSLKASQVTLQLEGSSLKRLIQLLRKGDMDQLFCRVVDRGTKLVLRFESSLIDFRAEVFLDYPFGQLDPDLQNSGLKLTKEFGSTLDSLQDQLNIAFEGDSVVVHRQGKVLYQNCKLHFGFPSISPITCNEHKFQAIVKMPASEFSRICKLLEDAGKLFVWIVVENNNRVYFYGRDSFYSNKLEKIVESKEATVSQGNGYMTSVLNLRNSCFYKEILPSSPDVTIGFCAKIGLVLEYTFKEKQVKIVRFYSKSPVKSDSDSEMIDTKPADKPIKEYDFYCSEDDEEEYYCHALSSFLNNRPSPLVGMIPITNETLKVDDGPPSSTTKFHPSSTTKEVTLQLGGRSSMEFFKLLGSRAEFLVFGCEGDTELVLHFLFDDSHFLGFGAAVHLSYQFGRLNPNLQNYGFTLKSEFVEKLDDDQLIIKLEDKMVTINRQGIPPYEIDKQHFEIKNIPSIRGNEIDFRAIIKMSASEFSKICHGLAASYGFGLIIVKDEHIVHFSGASFQGNKMETGDFVPSKEITVSRFKGYSSSIFELLYTDLYEGIADLAQHVTIGFRLGYGLVFEFSFTEEVNYVRLCSRGYIKEREAVFYSQ